MRVRLVGHGHDFAAGSQLEPFARHRARLWRRGLTCRRTDATRLTELADALERTTAAVAFVVTSWREPADAVVECFQRVRTRRPDLALVYLDHFDQSCSPYLALTEHVDLYVKRQLLAPAERYREDLHGGYVVTDYLAREGGVDIGAWSFGSRLPAGGERRLALGWNLGAAARFESLLEWSDRAWRRPQRAIDVHCRVSLGPRAPQEWYAAYRLTALGAVRRLEASYRVVASGRFEGEAGGATPAEYLRELAASRVVFSPFGWGELCWRDFEAVALGCLLVKPSVAHLVTEPDLFVPDETYVPVRWDFADLEERCRHYLERPEDCARIVANARRAYKAYFAERRVVSRIRDLVSRAVSERGAVRREGAAERVA